MQAGENIIYTISYKNPSDYGKTAVITDSLPEDVGFVSASDGGVYDEGTHTAGGQWKPGRMRKGWYLWK